VSAAVLSKTLCNRTAQGSAVSNQRRQYSVQHSVDSTVLRHGDYSSACVQQCCYCWRKRCAAPVYSWSLTTTESSCAVIQQCGVCKRHCHDFRWKFMTDCAGTVITRCQLMIHSAVSTSSSSSTAASSKITPTQRSAIQCSSSSSFYSCLYTEHSLTMYIADMQTLRACRHTAATVLFEQQCMQCTIDFQR
jgi:hypothetical protein